MKLKLNDNSTVAQFTQQCVYIGSVMLASVNKDALCGPYSGCHTWLCPSLTPQIRKSEKNLLEKMFTVIHHLTAIQVGVFVLVWLCMVPAWLCIVCGPNQIGEHTKQAASTAVASQYNTQQAGLFSYPNHSSWL